MDYLKTHSVRSLLAAAAAFAGVCTLTSHIALAQAEAGASAVAASSDAETTLRTAADLMRQGESVRARAMLQALVGQDQGKGLTDAERTRAYDLLASANRRINSMNPLEASLQRAAVAIDDGDLRGASLHARKVESSATADAGQRERAQSLLATIASKQQALAPSIAESVTQAAAEFEAGNVNRAKELLATAARSGVELPADVNKLAETYRAKIADLEHTTPAAASTGLSMLQPEQPAQPQDQPQNQPPAPAPESQPAAQPASQPPSAAPASPQEELIRSARRYEAQSTLAEADQAYSQGRMADAESRYSRLATLFREYLTPEQVKTVDDRLQEARLSLRGSVSGSQPLTQLTASRQLAKDQALAEFNNELAQSRRALDTGDTGRARDLVVKARLTLNSARNFLAETEFENYDRQTRDLQTQIDQAQERIAQQTAAQREAALKSAANDAEKRRMLDRENKIRENIERVRALQREMKYDEALQVVDQILFLDPINPAGLLLRDILTDAKIYRDWARIQDRKSTMLSDMVVGNQEAILAPSSIVGYPADWPAISYRRGEPVQLAESADDRRIRTTLETRKIPVDFKDNTLSDVANFIQAVTQLNVDVDWQSLETIGVTPETTLSLKLTNVPVKTVLERVLDKVSPDTRQRAGWAISDGVLRIASDDLLRKSTETVVYDVRDLLLEVPDYNNAPEFDLQSVLQSGQGSNGQNPFRYNNQNQQQDTRPRDERTRDIIDIIQQNIDFDGWKENGGTTGYVQQLNGNLIITNTPKNHQAITGLLRKLREVRAMQINVETRFLLVNQDFYEQIGFDIDVYFNANNNQVRAAQANDPTVQASDFFDRKTGNLKRSVTGAGTDTNGDGTADLFITQGVVNPRPTSVIGVTQNSDSLVNGLVPSEGIAKDIKGAAPALGIAGQFLDDVQVDFLIQATQADRRSVRLTAPRLTFTNGQRSNIYVATQTAFVSDLTPVVSESAVGFDPQLDTISAGVRLVVEGTISADRRYVTLNVDASVSTLDALENRPVTAVAGGQLVSSADTQSFIQVPTVTVTRVQTTVTVPDQGTILLGGQRLVSELEVESGVPVLSKIPILNRFFSNRVKTKDEQTLLILIKPTVLIQTEEEERNYPGLADAVRAGIGG